MQGGLTTKWIGTVARTREGAPRQGGVPGRCPQGSAHNQGGARFQRSGPCQGDAPTLEDGPCQGSDLTARATKSPDDALSLGGVHRCTSALRPLQQQRGSDQSPGIVQHQGGGPHQGNKRSDLRRGKGLTQEGGPHQGSALPQGSARPHASVRHHARGRPSASARLHASARHRTNVRRIVNAPISANGRPCAHASSARLTGRLSGSAQDQSAMVRFVHLRGGARDRRRARYSLNARPREGRPRRRRRGVPGAGPRGGHLRDSSPQQGGPSLRRDTAHRRPHARAPRGAQGRLHAGAAL